jgi:hypothetical protein
MADVSKLTGFAVMAPPPDSEVVSKLSGFAVMAPPSNGIALTKLTGFAVLYPTTVLAARPIVNCVC